MVYLHFPSNLTDEELMLQAKYQKLRKKKKALQDMKAPKPEPEKINPLKRPLDPKDAKELAKKLIQSGKVSIPTKPTIEKTTFKRSRILERKITSTGRSEGHGGMTPSYNTNFTSEAIQFEPFTPQMEKGRSLGEHRGNYPEKEKRSSESEKEPSFPHAYDRVRPSGGGAQSGGRIAHSRANSSSGGNFRNNYGSNSNSNNFNESSGNSTPSNKPKRGPTVYVHGHNITEDILKSVFGKFGKILNVRMNLPSSKAFVTFDKTETADTAITEVNGNTIEDIFFEVQYARRQPSIAPLLNDSSASATWTALAVSQSHKGAHHDRRQQVVYDEPMDLL